MLWENLKNVRRRAVHRAAVITLNGVGKNWRKARTISNTIKTLPLDAETIVRFVAQRLWEKKANALVALDMRGMSDMYDMMLIASARNERHAKQLVGEVEDGIKERFGLDARAIEGADSGAWALLDFGYCVVHIFLEESRDFYRLEHLWSQVPRIDLDLPEEIEP